MRRARTVRCVVGMALTLVFSASLAPAAGAARAAASKPAIVRARFHRAYGPVFTLQSDGRYTFIGTGQRSGGGFNLLRDEKTGHTLRIPGACEDQTLLGGPYLLITPCSPSSPQAFDLYQLANGRETVVTAPLIACDALMGVTCTAEGVGSQWVEFVSDCYHCQSIDYVERISDGALQRTPALPSDELLDLNRLDLRQRLCSPIRVPPGGAVHRAGPFAVILTAANSTYLERCGERRRREVLGFVGLNADAVLWTAPPHVPPAPHLGGMFRRSGRGLLVRPTGVGTASLDFTLAGPRLYAVAMNGVVFAGRAPTP